MGNMKSIITKTDVNFANDSIKLLNNMKNILETCEGSILVCLPTKMIHLPHENIISMLLHNEMKFSFPTEICERLNSCFQKSWFYELTMKIIYTTM